MLNHFLVVLIKLIQVFCRLLLFEMEFSNGIFVVCGFLVWYNRKVTSKVILIPTDCEKRLTEICLTEFE